MRLKMFDPLSIELRDNMIYLSLYKKTNIHDCNCEHCNYESENCPYCLTNLEYVDYDEKTKVYTFRECKKKSAPRYVADMKEDRNKEIISLLEK